MTFENTITLVTVSILAVGILTAGYFGARDKSWRNSAAGWKDSFDREVASHSRTKDDLKKSEAELIALRSRPDLTALSAALLDHDKRTHETQVEMIGVLKEIRDGVISNEKIGRG